MSHPLWSLSGAELGAYYEERVLAWLGWDAESAPLGELASAYRDLSDRLNRSAGGPPSGVFGSRVDLAVRALVYGWRSVLVARRLLKERGDPMVEVGSGLGPFGLVASAGGRDVTLVDAAAEILREAPGYFEAFGLGAPDVRACDLEAGLRSEGLVVLPYSALEWAGDSAKRRSRLARALRDRRVLVVERGTKEGGHFVQALRDEVEGAVSGPCPARRVCSLAERRRDWCHFTWTSRPGPLTRRIADKAGRRWSSVHVSWVASGAPEGAKDRVLWVRPEGKHKMVAGVCSSEGFNRWVAERRDEDAFQALDALPSGALVQLERGEARGDGVRVRSGDDVTVVRGDVRV